MSEFRRNFLNGSWVIVSTERAKRPKDFKPQIEERIGVNNCPFCPGNEKLTPPENLSLRKENSLPDSPGWQIRVFPNKFPALSFEVSETYFSKPYLSELYPGVGKHLVIVETPEHFSDIKELSDTDFLNILKTYQHLYLQEVKDPVVKYISIFRNYKREGGASLEHPHSQLLTLPFLPTNLEIELKNILDYKNQTNGSIFEDYLEYEKKEEKRIVYEGSYFYIIAPFASRFPFETWILPKREFSSFSQINNDELTELAAILKKNLKALSTLGDPAYNYYFHSLEDSNEFRFHIEIVPRLSKQAGFEWDTGVFINSTIPEEAAIYLKENF